MICTQVTQISHSTVGSSFSVSFSANSNPSDLEMLRMMRDWFMRWNNSGVSFTKADTPQTKQSDSEYYLELADAVMRGEMSDASANQAWYEYINKQDTPQTDCGWK